MGEAYKNHRAGSAMGAVHKAFDEKGKDAAKKKGESLGLEPHTVRAAISLWERKIFSRGSTGKKSSKKAAKKAGKRVVRKTKASKAAPRKVRPVKRVVRATKAAAPVRVPRPAKKASAAAA